MLALGQMRLLLMHPKLVIIQHYSICLCGLTTQALGGHRCIICGDVLQHHDASTVIPLYVDPTRCLDQVHAACVFHIKGVKGEW